MAADALDRACASKPPLGRAKDEGHSQEAKGRCDTKSNHRWKRKIRATFPLVFIKHFQKGPETVPEADSDVEEKPASSDGVPQTSSGGQQSSLDSALTASRSSTPKKRLLIPRSEKEKLLDWEALDTPQETHTKTTQRPQKDQVAADADQPPTNQDPPQSPKTTATASSTFQVIANVFRKTFSGSNVTNGNTDVNMRPLQSRDPRRQRPLSEGTFGLSSLFSASREEDAASVAPPPGADPWGGGQDLATLLQQVSLRGRWGPQGGACSDDMAALPRRRLDVFSSLRLKKKEAPQGEEDHEGQREIRTILSNLRNKASGQQSPEESSSSDDEDELLTSTMKLQKKSERTVAQQAKREQLKRLHRAQVIQRQLEEVEEKQREVEERGVAMEKGLRGETGSPPADEGEEAQLYQSWFKLVLEKNRLARYESELTIFAQELELEDTQSRLQQDLRSRMAVEDCNKSASELQAEQLLLAQIMKTVERRDMLVSVLEQQRLKERAEDRDLESLVLSRGYQIHWAPASDCWGPDKSE